MQIVSWNVQWGLGMDGRLDLARIVDHALALGDVDVLCLQEIADNLPDLKGSRGEDQFARVATLMPGYRAIAGAGLEIVDAAGETRRFGNMILSRLPVRQVVRHTLPWLGGAKHSMPRSLLEATIMARFGPVRVMTTHLEYFSGRLRAAQVDAIRAIHAAACDREDRPREPGQGPYAVQPGTRSAVLTGDFNLMPDDPTTHRLADPIAEGVPALVDAWRVLRGDAPHPASFCIADQTYGQPHCSDYVFVTEDLSSRLVSIRYDGETRLSDHQPVLVTLRDSPDS